MVAAFLPGRARAWQAGFWPTRMEEGARFLSGASSLGHLNEQSCQVFGATTYCLAPNSVPFSGTGPSSTYTTTGQCLRVIYCTRGRLVGKPAIGASFLFVGSLLLIPLLGCDLLSVTACPGCQHSRTFFSPQKNGRGARGGERRVTPSFLSSLSLAFHTRTPTISNPPCAEQNTRQPAGTKQGGSGRKWESGLLH